MSDDIDNIKKELSKAEKQIVNNVHDLLQATEGALGNMNTASSDSLTEELRGGSQPVVIGNMEIYPPGDKSKALLDVQDAEAKQYALRVQYEKDKNFFEQQVLSKTRGLCEIQEDYIKVLHPHYRLKFLEGIRRYGTVAAAMKWMKDNYNLKLRGDILRRITTLIPSFKQEIDDAEDEYQAVLHMEMHRRAVEGTDKGIYYNGDKIATEKVYSDSLLVKMVDTYNPEYKDAKTSDKKSGGINIQIIKDFHDYKKD